MRVYQWQRRLVVRVQQSTLSAIRFGYGFRPGEDVPVDAAGLVARLQQPDVNPLGFSNWSMDEALDERRATRKALRDHKAGKAGAAEAYDALKKRSRAQGIVVAKAAFGRAIYGRDGFRERLVMFWRDHFTTVAKVASNFAFAGDYIDGAIRPNITGRFSDLLRATITHPAMLAYLDQNASAGSNSRRARKGRGGLNENLARELLELHTLGVGAEYNQRDVRQLAELLAGTRFVHEELEIAADRAQPGVKQVLGRNYGGGKPALDDVFALLDDLAAHPATARHVASKLAVHFISDDPDPALVDHISARYQATGGDLMAVYSAMLEHPAAWGEFGQKAKQPFDLLVSGMRALDLPQAVLEEAGRQGVRRHLLGPMLLMGQNFLQPNGPDGWPEAAEDWITPQGLAGRVQWATDAAQNFGADRDPRVLLETALADAAGPGLRFAINGAASRQDGLALILASPEFNRR